MQQSSPVSSLQSGMTGKTLLSRAGFGLALVELIVAVGADVLYDRSPSLGNAFLVASLIAAGVSVGLIWWLAARHTDSRA